MTKPTEPLNAGENMLFIGNFLSIAGSFFIGLGTLWKLSKNSGLPTGRPVFQGRPGDADTHQAHTASRDVARDFFSL